MSVRILDSYKADAAVLQRVAAHIEKNDNFLLTTHVGSDADGIGSQVALAGLLRKLNKKVCIVNNELPTQNLYFLDPQKEIKSFPDLTGSEKSELFSDVFVFILDSSNPKRSYQVGEHFIECNLPWASIDHHDLSENDHYCVDASYAATAEMIWDLYQYFNIEIDSQSALSLYGGLIADSGNFRYGKTSMRTHLAGGHLISLGIDSDRVYRALYESHPIDRLKYLGRIIKGAYINKEKGYIAGVIPRKLQKGLDLGDAPNEGIVNQLLALDGIQLSALMTETEDGQLKCSLRSIGKIDVNELASHFGGGGHKNASGFKADLKFKRAVKKVIALIDQTMS